MFGVKPLQDPGSVQKVVHERVDRDHAPADLSPPFSGSSRAEQQRRQCHAPHLVGCPVDVPQRLKDRVSKPHAVGAFMPCIRMGEPRIDPANEITACDILDK